VISGRFSLAARGRYSAWISGSFDRRIELSIDGRPVGKPHREFSISHPLFVFPSYTFIGKAVLGGGLHSLTLTYRGGGILHPGTGGRAAVPALVGRSLVFDFGPIVLTRDNENLPLAYVRPSRARTLCAKSWDWIEALGPGPASE
jgi:hypothetical protein